MSWVLLLTATIHTTLNNSVSGRIKSDDRENDYYLAVQFYLSKGYKVVFVENSNTLSKKILSLQTTDLRLEYLTFPTNLSTKGKSWGEVEIFDYALQHSVFLKEINYLIKITGRYIIRNIKEVIEPTNYVEKELYINPTRNFRWADTRLMIMKKSFYQNYFLKTANSFLDEHYKVNMENIFIKSLFLYMYDGGELVLWPTYPFYDAFDGTHNEKITFGFFKSIKYKFYYKIKRNILNHRA